MTAGPNRHVALQDGVDLLDPLLPTLQGLVEGGPCIFFALRMLEVDPRPNHLEFIVAAPTRGSRLYRDTELWVDHLLDDVYGSD